MKKRYIILALIVPMLLIFSGLANVVMSQKVGENKPLFYTITVTYDGRDEKGIESSENNVAGEYSNVINVEDKLPEGLTFEGFVAVNRAIVATKQDSSGSCSGYVVDDVNKNDSEYAAQVETIKEKSVYKGNDYKGLHYDPATRTITFKVNKLQAGGELKVVVATTTPTIDDPNTADIEKRRDFYNYAKASEEDLSVQSDVVHAYMGSDDAELYKVSYSFEGTVPSGVKVPEEQSYSAGVKVGVAANVNAKGYEFSGWSVKSGGVTISNGSFTMPTNDVELVGSFSQISPYKVTYQIEGEGPENYVVPKEKSYYKSNNVTLDTLKSGDIINGYKFLGWKAKSGISENNIIDGTFAMPNNDVGLVGNFEKVKYKVTYKFYGLEKDPSDTTNYILPPNPESLLPLEKQYAPGEKVTVANKPTANGYKFLGWYKEDTFTMPENDVVIYGEWQEVSGTFKLDITKNIVDKKESYKSGDVVKYKIAVKNLDNHGVENVSVKENKIGAKFLEPEDKNNAEYVVESANLVTIKSIPAKGSVDLYAEYTVTEDDKDTIENEAEILCASSTEKNYILEDGEYKSTSEFKVAEKTSPGTSNSGSSNNDKNDIDKTHEEDTKEEVLDEVNNKEKVEDSKEDIDSPKTYDNLYFYVILAMFSTAGIYLTRLKTKGKHFAK